jgi:hypothetical protein
MQSILSDTVNNLKIRCQLRQTIPYQNQITITKHQEIYIFRFLRISMIPINRVMQESPHVYGAFPPS